jgi:hypothetical protein
VQVIIIQTHVENLILRYNGRRTRLLTLSGTMELLQLVEADAECGRDSEIELDSSSDSMNSCYK